MGAAGAVASRRVPRGRRGRPGDFGEIRLAEGSGRESGPNSQPALRPYPDTAEVTLDQPNPVPDAPMSLGWLSPPPNPATFEKYFPSWPGQDNLRSAPIPPTAVAAV